jgi:hypothetical protein
MSDRTDTVIEEGKRRARAFRAVLTPEELARVEALEASSAGILARTYIGPPNDKGRQLLHIEPEETPMR